MGDLPIRKDGDELRVRDAAGVVWRGIVERVRDDGIFQIRMPGGHSYGSSGEPTRQEGAYSWSFLRNETADYGLTILGPWIEGAPAAALNIIAAAHGKIVVDTGSSLEIYSKDPA